MKTTYWLSSSLLILMGLFISLPASSLQRPESPANEQGQKAKTAHANSLGCDEACEDLFKKLERFARNGSPHAQTLLAVSYKNGESGVAVDSDLAWRWIKRAATQRHWPAVYIKSQWHRAGYASEKDIERADEYLARAAKYDFPAAIYDLAILNFQRKNDEQGFVLLNRVANMGYPKAKKLLQALESDIPEETRTLLAEQTATQKAKQLDRAQAEREGEVLTIVASREDPVILLGDLISEITQTNMYNRRGTTGSRVGDKKCGQVGSRCRVEAPPVIW